MKKGDAASYSVAPVAHIRTGFPTKFGVPRQSGLVQDLKAQIVFENAYRSPDFVRGLAQFSHIWVIWLFSENPREKTSATVRPPRLGGNVRLGVFATRSPFRPNGLGLSVLKLERIEETETEGCILHVSGADMTDGTPIVDIKPYLQFVDSVPDAAYGFAAEKEGYSLQVEIPQEILSRFPAEHRDALCGVLSQDPRPSYQEDPERVYGFLFCGYEVRFRVEDGTLTVTDIFPV